MCVPASKKSEMAALYSGNWVRKQNLLTKLLCHFCTDRVGQCDIFSWKSSVAVIEALVLQRVWLILLHFICSPLFFFFLVPTLQLVPLYFVFFWCLFAFPFVHQHNWVYFCLFVSFLFSSSCMQQDTSPLCLC